jgi:hypothetical protein
MNKFLKFGDIYAPAPFTNYLQIQNWRLLVFLKVSRCD